MEASPTEHPTEAQHQAREAERQQQIADVRARIKALESEADSGDPDLPKILREVHVILKEMSETLR